MLLRNEVENYLFDFEVITLCSQANGKIVHRPTYDTLVPNPNMGDLKAVGQQLKNLCGHQGSVEDFKVDLANHIKPGMAVYDELKAVIFP